jgi:hypothetical protein
VGPDDVHPDEMPDELDAFFDDLRSAAADAPPPVVGDALATLFREGAAPVAVPTRRRRIAIRAAVGGAVAGLAFGGLGVAGALPHPVQQRVADVVEHVGVHLPDDRPEPTTTTSTTVVPTPTTAEHTPSSVTPPTVEDDHGQGNGNGNGNGPGEDNGQHRGQDTTPTTADDQGSSGPGNSEGKGRNPHGVVDVHPGNRGPGSGHDERSDD